MRFRNEEVRSVLFVCTGNVFRSVVAEFAMRAQLIDPLSCTVASAGIEAKPQAVHAWVRHCLREKGADVSAHVPRRLTKDMLEGTDLVVAMSQDHQQCIRRDFGIDVPLFKQICYARDEPILDLHEAHPNWEQDLNLAKNYVSSVIDMIWKDIPSFLLGLTRVR
jgi:protein-tyrosine phosphatase